MTIFKLSKEQSEQFVEDIQREATKEELDFWVESLKTWIRK